MGVIGGYFHWAWTTHEHGFLALILFVVVVPGVALLIAALVLVWVLVAAKFLRQAAARGVRKGWNS